jgi:hypothetical protein
MDPEAGLVQARTEGKSQVAQTQIAAGYGWACSVSGSESVGSGSQEARWIVLEERHPDEDWGKERQLGQS